MDRILCITYKLENVNSYDWIRSKEAVNFSINVIYVPIEIWMTLQSVFFKIPYNSACSLDWVF